MSDRTIVAEEVDGIRAMAPTPAAARAEQILALLPILRQWVTARVQGSGAHRGLSLRQYAALHGIREGASSPGELARLWQVTPAVLTGIVDRLESRGLVRREPDPMDRRRLRLALTEQGIAASLDIERALTDDLAAQLGMLSPDELAELGRSLDLLHQVVATLREQTSLPIEATGVEDEARLEDQTGADQHEMRRYDLTRVRA
jgi:DNA-binding MarR family transcriptional regulator